MPHRRGNHGGERVGWGAAAHRTADHPRGVSDNEADIRGRGKLGGHDQVALIFAALVVRNHNQLSLLDRLDRRDHRLRPELRWCHHGLLRGAGRQLLVRRSGWYEFAAPWAASCLHPPRQPSPSSEVTEVGLWCPWVCFIRLFGSTHLTDWRGGELSPAATRGTLLLPRFFWVVRPSRRTA